jgi:hypothetical protein
VHGELAQVIALAAHGSAWLKGILPGPPPPLDADNSTFQYVRRVRFDFCSSSVQTTATVADVGGWLQGARAREIDRLWLLIPDPRVVVTDGEHAPDRMLVAFAGAGQWFLLGTSAEPPRELWRGSWTVGDEGAPDRRIWDIEYSGEPVAGTIEPVQGDISVCAQRLLDALEQIEAFAREQQLGDWADWFAEARELDQVNDPSYHPDMLPNVGYSEPARRLLAMATRTWVFGGMGSWNDLVFSVQQDESEYERLSAALYAAVLAAFVAAVNTELAGLSSASTSLRRSGGFESCPV